MVVDELLTGLRMGGIVVFAWLGVRVLLHSWHVTEQDKWVRDEAWRPFRASILVMCFVMVFLASPENILRANGYISERTGHWMMVGVTAGAMLYACLTHHGIDIVNRQRGSLLSCMAICFLFFAYAVGRAV